MVEPLIPTPKCGTNGEPTKVPYGADRGTVPGLPHLRAVETSGKENQGSQRIPTTHVQVTDMCLLGVGGVLQNIRTKASEQAFQTLKQVLTSSPVLRNSDFGCPFTTHVDASDSGLGLTPTERSYAAME